jgi:hypothetical protein
MNYPFLNAVTFSAGMLLKGVAVGDTDTLLNRPKIRWIDGPSLSNRLWEEPTTVYDAFPDEFVVTGSLVEVDWAAGVEFWAAGTDGLVYYSDPNVGPSTWHQFVPPGQSYAQFSSFDMSGVSFPNATDGVFVGSRIVGSSVLGKAYHYHNTGSTVTWTEMSIPNEPSLTDIADVVFDGSIVYAAGVRTLPSGANEGVILKASFSGSSFGPLAAVNQTFAQCSVGESPTDVPVLNEIEIAPGGAIWAGGQCGRLWRSTDGVQWSAVRSATDAHVRGMSFYAADSGFVAGHRTSRTGHSIVAITP